MVLLQSASRHHSWPTWPGKDTRGNATEHAIALWQALLLQERQEMFCCHVHKRIFVTLGVCSDDVSKIHRELRTLLKRQSPEFPVEFSDATVRDVAAKLASLSSWYVHPKPFTFAHAGQSYTFRCAEQLMMAEKLHFFGYEGEAAREWLNRIQDAEKRLAPTARDLADGENRSGARAARAGRI